MARKKCVKKRTEMTAEELELVRQQDRVRKQLRRLQLDEAGGKGKDQSKRQGE